jgi:hypothetical protein
VGDESIVRTSQGSPTRLSVQIEGGAVPQDHKWIPLSRVDGVRKASDGQTQGVTGEHRAGKVVGSLVNIGRTATGFSPMTTSILPYHKLGILKRNHIILKICSASVN